MGDLRSVCEIWSAPDRVLGMWRSSDIDSIPSVDFVFRSGWTDWTNPAELDSSMTQTQERDYTKDQDWPEENNQVIKDGQICPIIWLAKRELFWIRSNGR